MTAPAPKACATCGRGIAPSEVYYRFSLVLQVEQDMIGTLAGGGSEEELAAVMKQLEESPESPQELEEQVHWERAGVVCTACRALVVRTL
ncbi:MAG TPA: hypothetical protein VK458_17125, partial [Myxococcaceae bacterium]|nr:hypothetical protein [Myxococcaceae bacterium]